MKKAGALRKGIMFAGINRLLAELSQDEAKPGAAIFRHEQWPVDYWVDQARLAGHLIIENNQGYLLAPDFDSFNQWRKQYVIPKLVYTLDMLRAMGASAKAQFDREDDPDSVFPLD